MIKGIPYFGENTQEIYKSIIEKNKKDAQIKTYDSLYDIITENIDKKIIVIIDNKWLSWLNDIKFNYKEDELYIPYFEYELFETDKDNFRGNNKGHLININGTLYLRYNYFFKKYSINIDNLSLYCVDIDTMQYYILKTNKWILDDKLCMDKLYKLYSQACFKSDDFILNKHSGGYHYINSSTKQYKNKEKHYRIEYNLLNYINYREEDFNDYRDVREYKYEQVVTELGMIDTGRLYRERRLLFESYLYCCIKAGLFNDVQFKHGRYKLGKNIVLILKEYWLTNNIDKTKTYLK